MEERTLTPFWVGAWVLSLVLAVTLTVLVVKKPEPLPERKGTGRGAGAAPPEAAPLPTPVDLEPPPAPVIRPDEPPAVQHPVPPPPADPLRAVPVASPYLGDDFAFSEGFRGMLGIDEATAGVAMMILRDAMAEYQQVRLPHIVQTAGIGSDGEVRNWADVAPHPEEGARVRADLVASLGGLVPPQKAERIVAAAAERFSYFGQYAERYAEIEGRVVRKFITPRPEEGDATGGR
ncbi:MAG: hypothetical protein HY608_01605 [Planctomycetes bacterium]|nr:hypothetical protein [Planctomycetota bacterium]